MTGMMSVIAGPYTTTPWVRMVYQLMSQSSPASLILNGSPGLMTAIGLRCSRKVWSAASAM